MRCEISIAGFFSSCVTTTPQSGEFKRQTFPVTKNEDRIAVSDNSAAKAAAVFNTSLRVFYAAVNEACPIKV